MTKFVVEKLNPDWTGQGLTISEVMALDLANARTVLRKAREQGTLTMVGQEESWKVFYNRGQAMTKKWRGYFEKGERKYCTMQRKQTLWTLIDDLAQREMQKMFERLGSGRVPRQWHKQILLSISNDRRVIKNEAEKIQWNSFRIGITIEGSHSAGPIRWQWKIINGAVVFNIFSSWGYAQVSIKIFKDRWGMWDFAVDSFNNKWNGEKR